MGENVGLTRNSGKSDIPQGELLDERLVLISRLHTGFGFYIQTDTKGIEFIRDTENTGGAWSFGLQEKYDILPGELY